MSHTRTRELENRARGDQTPENVANFLKAHLREGMQEFDAARLLSTFIAGVRAEALELIVEMSPGQKLVLELNALMAAQIDHALKSAVRVGQGDAQLPEKERILQRIHQQVDATHARIFLNKNHVHEPKLALVSYANFYRLGPELRYAARSMKPPRGPFFSRFAEDNIIDASQYITRWEFVISEGAQVFDHRRWDRPTANLATRIKRFDSRYSSCGITRLNYPSYIALMIDSLRNGKPLDCKYENDSGESDAQLVRSQETILAELGHDMDSRVFRRAVATATWYPKYRQVILGHAAVDKPNESARFRCAFRGGV